MTGLPAALVLTLVVAFAYRRYVGPPFFLAIARRPVEI